MTVCVLIVAKAPVPGLAKTRLCPPATARQAADIAAASLLDTITTVLRTPATVPVVALTGELEDASRADELRTVLRRVDVIPQRGNGFSERLAHAHLDTADRHPGLPVFQIGMDTPQLTPALVVEAMTALRDADAVLGPAHDGGWWALGLRDPWHADALRDVPMSRCDTGVLTSEALTGRALAVTALPFLSDVDEMDDARSVAHLVPDSRFARAVAEVDR
jgi:uncharacterized protein